MSEANGHTTWTYVKSVDPRAWYPPAFGFLVRLRSIFVELAIPVVSAVISAGLGYWVIAAGILVVGLSVGGVLYTIRSYLLRRLNSETELHELTHDLRDAVNEVLTRSNGAEKRVALELLHRSTAQNVADYFRTRSGDKTINCVIRIARFRDNQEEYVTVARSKGMDRERDSGTQPLRPTEGIAKALLAKKGEGAFIIRDVSAAVKDDIWKNTVNDQLTDARTWLVCPINGWHAGEKSVLGILHVTSCRDAFRPSDWLPLKAFADLLGLVYPLIYDPEILPHIRQRAEAGHPIRQPSNPSVAFDRDQDAQSHGG